MVEESVSLDNSKLGKVSSILLASDEPQMENRKRFQRDDSAARSPGRQYRLMFSRAAPFTNR